jgi:hypothetical protein
MQTPSQILARKTLERLRAEKLLTAGEVKKLLSKFAEGKVSAEDWQLAVENSSESETKT